MPSFWFCFGDRISVCSSLEALNVAMEKIVYTLFDEECKLCPDFFLNKLIFTVPTGCISGNNNSSSSSSKNETEPEIIKTGKKKMNGGREQNDVYCLQFNSVQFNSDPQLLYAQH